MSNSGPVLNFAAEALKNKLFVSRGWVGSFLSGVGMSYAIQQEKYRHIPLAVFFPSVYAGYQLNKAIPLVPVLKAVLPPNYGRIIRIPDEHYDS